MDFEHATPELFAALAAAQAEVENANKNSANPHFRSRYADLAEVLNTVRPVFAQHGIAIVQAPSFDGALVTVTTALVHAGGGRITSEMSCVPAKSDSQGVGACATYLRRYSLAAMAGIAQEDLDGNDSAHAGKPVPIAAAKNVDRWLDARQALRDASTVSELGNVWRDLSADARKALADEKDAAKARLTPSEAPKEVSHA
jgi:hypothetical protein